MPTAILKERQRRDAATAEYLVEAKGITKRYPGVVAWTASILGSGRVRSMP